MSFLNTAKKNVVCEKETREYVEMEVVRGGKVLEGGKLHFGETWGSSNKTGVRNR